MNKNFLDTSNSTIALVIVIGVILLSNLTGLRTDLQAFINSGLSPVRESGLLIGRDARALILTVPEINDLRGENDRLLIENAKLGAKIANTVFIEKENELLKRELELGSDEKTVVLEVLGSDSSRNPSELYLSFDDAVADGDIALIGNLYVGKIRRGERDVRIELLTKGLENFSVKIIDQNALLVEENGVDPSVLEFEDIGLKSVPAVLTVTGAGVKLENIDKSQSIRDGDFVFLSDESLPRVYFAGYVGAVDSDASSSAVEATFVPPIRYEDISKVSVNVD